MNHRMADLLESLEKSGELVRVQAEVDPALELAEVTQRAADLGAPTLLFGSVRGHDLPVLTNLLAQPERICRALGTDGLDALACRVAEAIEPGDGGGWLQRLRGLPGRSGDRDVAPRKIKNGPCQQVVRLGGDVDLGRLPMPTSRPAEAVASITAGVVLSVGPEAGHPTVARYDLARLDGQRLALCWDATDPHSRLLDDYRRRNQQMPLAVVLGGPPAALLAAMAPLPHDVDGWALAGLLGAAPIDVVATRSVELLVPAEAEIVLEGYVDPAAETVEVGPLATQVGYYARRRAVPVMQVTGITHRANPIFPAMIPGAPPNELTTVGRSLVEVFLPMLRAALPGLVDCDLPEFGAARHWALVSIRKTHPGQARQIAAALWALRPLMFAKMLVVVDEHVDVRDPQEVWYAMATCADPARDVSFAPGPPDPLDPTAAPNSLSGRMTVDATRKLPEETPSPPADPALVSEEVRQTVANRWSEYKIK